MANDRVEATLADRYVHELYDQLNAAMRMVERVDTQVNELKPDIEQVLQMEQTPTDALPILFARMATMRKMLGAMEAKVKELVATGVAQTEKEGVLHAALVRHFEHAGLKSVKLEDGSSISLQSDIRHGVGEEGRGAVVAALKGNRETCDFVSEGYSWSQLNAWIKELPRDKDGNPQLPKYLDDKIKVNEVFSVVHRKGGS